MDAPNKDRRRPIKEVVDICDGLIVIKKDDTFILNVFSKTIELDEVQAISLRNMISQWANNKRTRDHRNGVPHDRWIKSS